MYHEIIKKYIDSNYYQTVTKNNSCIYVKIDTYQHLNKVFPNIDLRQLYNLSFICIYDINYYEIFSDTLLFKGKINMEIYKNVINSNYDIKRNDYSQPIYQPNINLFWNHEMVKNEWDVKAFEYHNINAIKIYVEKQDFLYKHSNIK